MGQFFTEIPESLVPWIYEQKMFWVASAPLAGSGHVNVSPKGFEGTFHVVDNRTVWYEDLTGSGNETISHVRENGRLTIMFCAFEGPPRILRLFGTGTIHEFDTPEYDALIPLDGRQPGSRSVIRLDIHKVGTSCGFSIPFYTFKAPRMRLHKYFASLEVKDIETSTTCVSTTGTPHTTATASQGQEEKGICPKGLKAYWAKKNQTSIDGLPGVLTAFKSLRVFHPASSAINWGQDDESLTQRTHTRTLNIKADVRAAIGTWLDARLVIGFVLGFIVSGLWSKLDPIFETTSFRV